MFTALCSLAVSETEVHAALQILGQGQDARGELEVGITANGHGSWIGGQKSNFVGVGPDSVGVKRRKLQNAHLLQIGNGFEAVRLQAVLHLAAGL